MTDVELAAFESEMRAQGEELRHALASDLGGTPSDYVMSASTEGNDSGAVTDGGDDGS
jgi:hypothetical protein